MATHPVYRCQLTAENGNKIQCKVTVKPDPLHQDTNGRIYDVHPDGGGLTLPIGCMTTEWRAKSDEDVITDRYVEICKLKNLTSRNKVKGIGTLLLECALAQSIACGRKGHLQLTARKDSHLFFYSRGFRARENDLNERMAEKFKQAQEKKGPGSVKSLGKFIMYLPQETNQLTVTEHHLQFEYHLESEIDKLRNEQRLEALRKNLQQSKVNFNKEKLKRVTAEKHLEDLAEKHQKLTDKNAKDMDFKDVLKKGKGRNSKHVSFAEPIVMASPAASQQTGNSFSTIDKLLKRHEELRKKINKNKEVNV